MRAPRASRPAQADGNGFLEWRAFQDSSALLAPNFALPENTTIVGGDPVHFPHSLFQVHRDCGGAASFKVHGMSMAWIRKHSGNHSGRGEDELGVRSQARQVEGSQKVREHPEFPSFRGRLELVRTPYLRSHVHEKAIYDTHVAPQVQKHVAPHATAMAAEFAVLTRMKKADPENLPKALGAAALGLSAVEKMIPAPACGKFVNARRMSSTACVSLC